ncbi:TRAP transporter large permease [Chelatococcus sp. GCM10030263]|uniref:TRAP transporter large permease n=1 Tax=Chelatococcus sp. GCM10030263 TaxID=3273387 RepID=UPI00360C84A1
MTVLGMSVLLTLLMLIGLPIAFGLILAALIVLLFISPIPLTIVPHTIVNSVDNWSLLAVPLYILMGELMVAAGITRRLIDFALSLVGSFRGALAHASVLSGIFLSGVSGSATADAAALGSTLIPAMKDKGYGGGFAANIVGAAAIIGPIIPPSIPMVVYGSLANVSIGRLFLAGIVPGLLMGLTLMATSFFVARRRGLGQTSPFSWPVVRTNFLSAGPAFIVPFVVVLGLVAGVFTATESGVIAVAAAILIGKLIYRELTLKGIVAASQETIVSVGAVLIVIAASAIFGKIMALDNVGELLVMKLLELAGGQPWLLLLYLNILLLLLGIFIEPLPILILITPILAEPLANLGIDPVQLGVVVILNLMIGMITAPVGTVMFIVMAIAKVSMREFVRESWPFMGALVFALIVITYVPAVTLWLPNLLMGSP